MTTDRQGAGGEQQAEGNAAWVRDVVAPAAKQTQDDAAFWPIEGVGPFAAVLPIDPGTAIFSWASGPNAVRDAVAKLRDDGITPLAVLDYVSAAQYGNEAMHAAFNDIVDQCLEERVALVGGETSEHNNLLPESTVTWVVAIGVRQ